MKILKAGIVLIVVLLALTLLTLRVTGLEPQYLDLNDLRAHHMIARPGLWLKGEVVTTPVTDWSFVDKVEHPGRSLNTVLVETRTPYFIPHSVRTVPFVRNGQLYIRSHQDRMDLQFPNDKSWTSNVARDPRVRIKIGDKLYEATMVLIADRAQAIVVLGKNPETLQNGPDGQEHVVGYDHVHRVFQRNIPEYGGNRQQSAVPKYEVDPFWAKLPDNWVVGPLGGACIDARDHVFVLHRQEGLTEAMVTARDRFDGAKARIKAPPVMEFDPQGNLVNSWGDAKVLGDYLHDCQEDKNNNVWIAGARSGFVQKFSHDGKLLLQIGKSGIFDSSDGTAKGKPLNSNAAQFFGPSAVDVDPQNGDVYVADGHGGGNTRIAVLDKNGKFLRQWRLYHTEAEKDIGQLPHCMRLSNDGLVYVCDRLANRLQVFDKMGNFKRNIDIPWKKYTMDNEDLRKYCLTLWRTFPPCTLVQKIGEGTSAVSVEFSRDPNQRFIYVVNQNQREVDILDRATGNVLSTIGHGTGLFFPGQLFDAIRAAVDSKGNVYVAEDEGRRLQRFKVVVP